jgi:hypothetical protein
MVSEHVQNRCKLVVSQNKIGLMIPIALTAHRTPCVNQIFEKQTWIHPVASVECKVIIRNPANIFCIFRFDGFNLIIGILVLHI